MQHLENQGCYKLRKLVEWYKIPLSPQRKRKSAMASFFSCMATGEDLTARWVFFQARFLAMHHVCELMPFLHVVPLVPFGTN